MPPTASSTLIENLLRVSRIDSNSPAPRREPVRLAEVVARAARVVQGSYPGQRIDTVGPPTAIVTADPQHTERLLTNLLDNAAKYSEEGSPIHVAWELEAGMVALRVRDSGAWHFCPRDATYCSLGLAACRAAACVRATSAPGWVSI